MGAVMFWARLTCFYPHGKSGVFHSSSSILSVYPAPRLTSLCLNISILSVWVLFINYNLQKLPGTVKCQQLRPFYWESFVFCKLNINSHFSVIFLVVLLGTFFSESI